MTFPTGTFRRRVAWVFGVQFLFVLGVCILAIYDVLATDIVVLLIVAVTLTAWLAVRRVWRPVRALARIVNRWDRQQSERDQRLLDRLSAHIDADVASLAQGLRGFAARISAYGQRERTFTRDASHELRSPLTVIKLSVDALNEEQGLSDFGARSVRRIKSATREMEVLVETMLMLAREADTGAVNDRFVVNEVLRREVADARERLVGRAIELHFEERASFALEGSSAALSALCWQLIRNASQQMEQGRVSITVLPGAVTVSNCADPGGTVDPSHPARQHGVDRHGFELAIARRISERFHWPLELKTRQDEQNLASIQFPDALPTRAESAASDALSVVKRAPRI